MITDDLLKWISPLLYPPEVEILKYHTKYTVKDIRIKNWNLVRKKYNLTHRQLRRISTRLKFLVILYELETVAFNL